MLAAEVAADEIRSRYGLATSWNPCGASTSPRSRKGGALSVPPAVLRPAVYKPAPPSPRYIQFLQRGFEASDDMALGQSSMYQSTMSFPRTESSWSSKSRLLAESLSTPPSGKRAMSANEIRQLTYRPRSVNNASKLQTASAAEKMFADSNSSWGFEHEPGMSFTWSTMSRASSSSLSKAERRRRRDVVTGSMPPVQAARRQVMSMRAKIKKERQVVRENADAGGNDSNSDGDDDDDTGQAVKTAGVVLGDEPAQVAQQHKKTNPFVEYDTKEKRLNLERRWLEEDQSYLESRVREARHSHTQAKLTMKLTAKTMDRPLTRQEALMGEMKQRKGQAQRPAVNWTRSLRLMQRELKDSDGPAVARKEAEERSTMHRSESMGAKLFAGSLSFLINKAKTG
mmetsp:Transcript_62687/g.149552  ORF Transcript_62687/g.149552 Transcript_62687/m.149552 type:complete len:398 (+) Transcript_62687:109-1302(+)|eukprot:CAMPEP_0178430966 /NCGR_PEP_ID=MMETSP0689_2-20121128/31593_1 /TAXON_ID=160604 /ORGANISM="Amphidinium massartii, Strain CS-259" /LENGTH=397 /DNA_ID=CAMNT_0020052841 /DNA_START=10 /DNA_END=1203 /DNA_ORIENTATION=+